MNKEEAIDILERYEEHIDMSCSCHINPPCRKCVNQPSKEMYDEAIEFMASIEV